MAGTVGQWNHEELRPPNVSRETLSRSQPSKGPPKIRGFFSRYARHSFLNLVTGAAFGLIVFGSLSFWARLSDRDPRIRSSVAAVALSGIYALSWASLDEAAFSQPSRHDSRSYLHRLVCLDQLHNAVVILFDLILALSLQSRAPSVYATSFAVGGMLYSGVFAMGLVALSAGLRYRQVSVPIYRPFIHGLSFPLFVFTLIVIMRALLRDDSLEPVFVVSRAGAVISLALMCAFFFFSTYTHADLFDTDYDEHDPSMTYGRASDCISTEPASLFRTLISFAILPVLAGLLSLEIADAESQQSSNHDHAPVSAQVVLPALPKLLVTMQTIRLALRNEIGKATRRTFGLAVCHGLIVTPVLVVTAWFSGREVLFAAETGQLILLFLQWRILNNTLCKGSVESKSTLDWFKGLVFLGIYVIFALYAYISW